MRTESEEYEMQIVIDITEKDYKNLRRKDKFNDMCLNYYERLIVQGTPLPKIHGRLIDARYLLNLLRGKCIRKHHILDAPTVIEEYCEE